MTTLNTIIEEEKKKLEDIAGYNYNLYLAWTVERVNTGEGWTFEQAGKELKDFLTTAMQRAYEAGAEERDTYWKERVLALRKELWHDYHNAQKWSEQKAVADALDTLLDNLK